MKKKLKINDDSLEKYKESCSCIEGNPCVDQYVCKNWPMRFAIAKQNGWKGF